jgi:hypothetical protein
MKYHIVLDLETTDIYAVIDVKESLNDTRTTEEASGL